MRLCSTLGLELTLEKRFSNYKGVIDVKLANWSWNNVIQNNYLVSAFGFVKGILTLGNLFINSNQSIVNIKNTMDKAYHISHVKTSIFMQD